MKSFLDGINLRDYDLVKMYEYIASLKVAIRNAGNACRQGKSVKLSIEKLKDLLNQDMMMFIAHRPESIDLLSLAKIEPKKVCDMVSIRIISLQKQPYPLTV